MAVKDLEILYDELPELFDLRVDPSNNWDDEWIFIQVDSPDVELPESLYEQDLPIIDQSKDTYNNSDLLSKSPAAGNFPGSYQLNDWSTSVPPPDALAFYLPFHYFYPIWWGIYLIFEGHQWMSDYIYKDSNGVLSWHEACLASQAFLYYHEAYHHNVESFATRMEIIQTKPLYRLRFQNKYFESKKYEDDVTCLLYTSDAADE